MMNRYLFSLVLDDRVYEIAKSRQITVIVYDQKDPAFTTPGDIRCENIKQWDRDAYRFSFYHNKEILNRLRGIDPDFFCWDGVDLLNAVNKDLFWHRRLEGMFDYFRKHRCGDSEIDEHLLRRNVSVLKKYVGISVEWLNGLFLSKPNDNRHLKQDLPRFLFYVNGSSFQRKYNQKLIETLGEAHCYVTTAHLPKQQGGGSQDAPKQSVMQQAKIWPRIRLNFLIRALRLAGADTLLDILRLRRNLIRGMQVNRSLFKKGAEVVFLIAQENTGFGIVTALQARKYGVISVNSHNGIKSGDVHNRDNEFDIWCVPDRQTKELLSEKCAVPGSQLFVSGHWMMDRVRNHKYSGCFAEFTKKIKRTAIISLFSEFLNMPGKEQVIRSLFDFVRHNPGAALMIRLHPSEDMTFWNHIDLPERCLLVKPWEDGTNDRLYDQISISKMAVVFGSTVALECTWFGIPVITYEEREASILYLADNKTVVHARDIVEFEQFTKTLFVEDRPAMGKENTRDVATVVAQKIFTELNNDAT